MTWYTNPALRCDGILDQIAANMVAGGWTENDATPYYVYTSTNNQGVLQYVQFSQVGSYSYIQLQGWRSWNNVSHTGLNGSDINYERIYLGGIARVASERVNLYMSVTANRVIIFIENPITNHRNWAYFGGLGSLAGTNDPGCVLMISSYENGNSVSHGRILYPAIGGAYWTALVFMSSWNNTRTFDTPITHLSSILSNPVFITGKFLLYPIIAYDNANPAWLRGDLDGLVLCPLGLAVMGHLDTITVGGTPYLVVITGGQVAVNTVPWVGTYAYPLAIVEA